MPIGAFLPSGAMGAASSLVEDPRKQPEPFIWGAGGSRMTADQVARDREMAAQLMRPDFSPVGHWAQGLGRVAENLRGALMERGARKADDQNRESTQARIAQLLAGNTDPNTAASIALDPYADPTSREFAMNIYKSATKRAEPIEVGGKLVDPTTMQVLGDFSSQPEVVRLSQIANDPAQPDHVRKAAADRVTAMNDPRVTASFPGGFYMGPSSGFSGAMGGGGPASTAPGGPAPPATLPPDFDFGGPTPSASGGFPDPMSAPGTMTSGRRTEVGNRLVGGVPGSSHLRGDGVDYAGTTVGALRGYFGPGARLLDEGDHIHATLPGFGRVPYFGKRGTTGLGR